MLSEEQAIDILQNQIADYVIGNYCTKCGDFIICENKDEDCYYIQAIDTVLTLITKLQKENEEKDKQIDLIIDEFYKKAKISTRCYLQKSVEKCMKYKNCKDCIKQYFAGLVEKE